MQELQREARLGLRICHRGKPALQGGQGHPREGPRQRAGRHRRARVQGRRLAERGDQTGQ